MTEKAMSVNVEDPRVLRVARALVDLVDAIRPSVVAQAAVTYYVSAKRGPHPPGKTARWCRDNFRSIPGGRKEGRDWVVAVSDYERWAATRARCQRATPTSSLRNRWSPRAALEAAGVRPSREGDS